MNFPNPHGHVFDQWGQDIVFDATGGQPYYGPSFSTKTYYPAMETQQGAEARATCGRVRSAAPRSSPAATSPTTMQGNLIVLNTIGFQGLLNYKLTEDGAGLKSTEVEPILSVGRRELPSGRRRDRARRRALLRRLAQPDHRPHAAQPARHVPRPRARPHLPRDLPGPSAAQAGEDRRRADSAAARPAEGARGPRPLSREDRAERPRHRRKSLAALQAWIGRLDPKDPQLRAPHDGSAVGAPVAQPRRTRRC